MANDGGPLAPIRLDELIWLTPSAPLKGIVEVDLRVLGDVDRELRTAADTIANSGLGSDESVLDGLLTAVVATYGDIDGLSPTADLTRAQSGLSQFEDDLDERDGTLEP